MALLDKVTTDNISGNRMALETKLSGIVNEDALGDSVHFYYKATMPSGGSMVLQPRQLTELVLAGTGVLTCDRKNCLEQLPIPCTAIQKGWFLSHDDLRNLTPEAAAGGSKNGLACLVWHPWTDLDRCVALVLSHHASYPGPGGLVGLPRFFLRRNECLSRSVQSAFRESFTADFFEIFPGKLSTNTNNQEAFAFII